MESSVPSVLQVSPGLTIFPVVHANGDSAVALRQFLLNHSFDCLAVPLPPSMQADVEQAVDGLPAATLVLQHPPPDWASDAADPEAPWSYVPIDPCQPVVAAIRVALGDRIPRVFVDREVRDYYPFTTSLPDPYALKRVAAHRFAAAILPAIPRPDHPQVIERHRHMAARLRDLRAHYRSILFVCSLLDWPWIRAAIRHDDGGPEEPEPVVGDTAIYQPADSTLMFMLGELPFITGLYERARAELDDDENLAVEGVKQLLLFARERYRDDLGGRARSITPHALRLCLKYIRNMTLVERRLTPDLYTIVMAAKQVVGDGFALHVAEAAGQYPQTVRRDWPQVAMGIDRLRLPDGEVAPVVSRLPGVPLHWRSCQLHRRPPSVDKRRWQMKWNPFAQCSWPPEDRRIENFRTHVADRARAVMGEDLARTEKFTTSIKDGIDIRDTLRHWHTGELYVKVLPPSAGKLDAVVMLFDSPADPRQYAWRTTWFAEHDNESTLAFFATDFRNELIGPGIGLATYGGALFLFPPVSIPDIWNDPRLDFATTLEERLLAAACLHSQCPRIALVSPLPPGAGWRRLARRFGKKWVPLPLQGFSQATIGQLRMVHVLNGHQIRSYAAHFIRKS